MTNKRIRELLIISLLILCGCIATQGQECDKSLETHIYKPQRLEVVKPCVTVAGVITFKKREADGDVHMRLKLDPQFASMLNDRNRTAQGNALVVEPICVYPVKQADAKKACKGYVNKIYIPKIGEHVQITGVYVKDNAPDHGWFEIHPPSRMEVDRGQQARVYRLRKWKGATSMTSERIMALRDREKQLVRAIKEQSLHAELLKVRRELGYTGTDKQVLLDVAPSLAGGKSAKDEHLEKGSPRCLTTARAVDFLGV